MESRTSRHLPDEPAASKPVQKPALAVKDPMSGFFVLRRKCISGLHFQPTAFSLLLEILARGHISSVTEVPFKFAPRQQGKSKANLVTEQAIETAALMLGSALLRRSAVAFFELAANSAEL
jgi:dolichol-phosphate mannosyltransferase